MAPESLEFGQRNPQSTALKAGEFADPTTDAVDLAPETLRSSHSQRTSDFASLGL